MWAVIELNDETIHVVPANDNGDPLSFHEPTEFCQCHPSVEFYEKVLVIHNEVH